MEGEEKLCVICVQVVIKRKSTEWGSIHDKEQRAEN